MIVPTWLYRPCPIVGEWCTNFYYFVCVICVSLALKVPWGGGGVFEPVAFFFTSPQNTLQLRIETYDEPSEFWVGFDFSLPLVEKPGKELFAFPVSIFRFPLAVGP